MKYILCNVEHSKKIKYLCNEVNIDLKIIDVLELNKIDRGVIYNLLTKTTKEVERILKKVSLNNNIKLINHKVNFNKKSIKELFDIKYYSNYNELVVFKGNSKKNDLEKYANIFFNYNPNYYYCVVKYKIIKNKYSLVGIDGLNNKNLNLEFIKKFKEII